MILFLKSLIDNKHIDMKYYPDSYKQTYLKPPKQYIRYWIFSNSNRKN